MNTGKKRSMPKTALGLTVIVLAIIGVVSIASSFIADISQKAEEKSREKFSVYEEFLSVVVMNDPDTFDDITQANKSQLISIAVWSLIEKNPEPDTYDYVDSGILIPQKDVEKELSLIFGDGVKYKHSTVDGGEGIEFRYSESKKGYIIPITGITPIYIPRVLEAKERESAITLQVGYLASSEWTQDEEGNMTEPEPSKLMEITLSKNNEGSFFVRSVRAL